MKSMYKSELARAAGVSPATFRRWLHQPDIAQRLRKLDVKPSDKILKPPAVEAIAEHFCIDV